MKLTISKPTGQCCNRNSPDEKKIKRYGQIKAYCKECYKQLAIKGNK